MKACIICQRTTGRFQREHCIACYNYARKHGIIPLLPDCPRGELHAHWNDELTYKGAHLRVARKRGKARLNGCTWCPRQAAEWAYTHDDPAHLVGPQGQEYSPDVNRYIPLCRSCHRQADWDLSLGRRDTFATTT